MILQTKFSFVTVTFVIFPASDYQIRTERTEGIIELLDPK